MLQSEWKRVINEIEKAIQKATASDKERYERSIKENSAPIVAPLNSLADQFERYKIQQQTSDERRASREKATIIGLMIAAFLTFLTAVIFYFQLNQVRIATRHTDEDAEPSIRIPSPLSKRLRTPIGTPESSVPRKST
jgi:hypothetical protein